MCWLAYLLAMESHFALHCYHAMTRRAINSTLRKFYVNVNYIPTRLRRQLLNSAATTRTQCYRPLFRVRFRELGHETNKQQVTIGYGQTASQNRLWLVTAGSIGLRLVTAGYRYKRLRQVTIGYGTLRQGYNNRIRLVTAVYSCNRLQQVTAGRLQ